MTNKNEELRQVLLSAKEKIRDDSIETIVRDLKIENWDGDKLKGNCPFHNENSSSFIWNDKTSSFHCFGCNKNYDIMNHYIVHYGMTSRQAIDKIVSFSGIDFTIQSSAKKEMTAKQYAYPRRVDEDKTQVVEYAKTRGLSEETLAFYDVTSNKYGNTLFNYYDANDVLTFIKARQSKKLEKQDSKVIGISPKEDKNKPDFAGAGSKPLLYGMNKVSQSGTLNIAEGEYDAMALHEAGITNAVSVPFGANTQSWIEYNYDWLGLFDKIILWMDNDEAGTKARREIIVRLGNHRCRYVEIPKELTVNNEKISLKDVNDVLLKLGKQAVVDLSCQEKELPIEGIMNLEDAEDFDPEKWDGLLTGIDAVDKEIINKFYFGTVVTVTGTPGSGKSTLVNQWFVVEAVNQGFGVTVFSGEMSPSILRGWIEVAMAGRENTKLKTGNNFVRVIEKTTREKIVNWYRGKIHILKDDDNNLDVVLSRAQQTVMVNGDKVIILDNLATLGLGENDVNTYSKQREMMNKLKTFAAKYNVLIVLVVHPRKPSSGTTADGVGGYEMSGSADIFNLCHYSLSVRRYSEKDKKGEPNTKGGGYKRGKEPISFDTCVQFYKNRLMGKLGKVDMYFDLSYRFYSKPRELWKRYGWDNNQTPLPNHDPNNHGVDDDIYEDGGD